MATTPTPISAANILFHTRLKQPSSLLSPAFFLKCSSPLHVNGITDTKTSKTSNNGVDSVLLDGFDKTTERNESSDIKKQETEPLNMVEYINQLEASVSEVARLQKQLSEARAMMDEGEYAETERSPIKKKTEKWESVKAASVSAIVGTLASLPISLTHVTTTHDLMVSTAVTIVTCALYGATYRYTILEEIWMIFI